MQHPAVAAHADTPASGGLRAVALFEAGKGIVAALGAVALLVLGADGLRHALESLLHLLRMDAMHGHPSPMLAAITLERVHLAVLVALLYAGLRFIEAWGLWRHRAWASWLGVIGAAAYLPFELDALARHPHVFTAGLLAINLLVVWVLVRDLMKRRRGRSPA